MLPQHCLLKVLRLLEDATKFVKPFCATRSSTLSSCWRPNLVALHTERKDTETNAPASAAAASGTATSSTIPSTTTAVANGVPRAEANTGKADVPNEAKTATGSPPKKKAKKGDASRSKNPGTQQSAAESTSKPAAVAAKEAQALAAVAASAKLLDELFDNYAGPFHLSAHEFCCLDGFVTGPDPQIRQQEEARSANSSYWPTFFTNAIRDLLTSKSKLTLFQSPSSAPGFRFCRRCACPAQTALCLHSFLRA